MADLENPDTALSPPADAALCVAICTYDRPVQLAALLDGLLAQQGVPPFLVVIVDNGTMPAATTVAPYRARLPIVLDRIPAAGLAAVRNRALQLGLSQGCIALAFIDDDEVPVAGWLAALLARQAETGADLVFGPVLATYHGTPPGWVIRGGFFERPGTTPGSGNVLIRLNVLPPDEAAWFLADFGQVGGEDAEFFDRLFTMGASRAVAPDAIAYEDTPPSRTSVRFIWKRGVRDGAVSAQRIAMKDWSRPRKLAIGARQMLAKLGHALNHFLWSPLVPWRAIKGIGDIGAAWAILLYALGHRFHFYGRNPKT
jgi:glycosyltransferase involved in cell wall biosynthesis